ncbi:MAG: exodeoxyribonuclease VII small subunit [Bacteroidaceae bacterium]|nr:exodeoxyribonuclease VII small subunit [Bacteroidaceae bacterium]
MTYEEAIRQLDDIVRQIETGQMGIDQLTAQLTRAQQLITFCRDILYKTDEEVQTILNAWSSESQYASMNGRDETRKDEVKIDD